MGALAVDTTLGPNDLTCDLTTDGDNQPAEAYAVTNSSGDLEAFGIDANGNDFCCINGHSSGPNDETVLVLGGSFDDTIALQWTDPMISTTYNLTNASGRDLYGVVQGAGGDDLIDGSNANSPRYFDYLYGGPGDDDIACYTGDDRAEGEAGNDTIDGGGGADLLYGGDGNDTPAAANRRTTCSATPAMTRSGRRTAT